MFFEYCLTYFLGDIMKREIGVPLNNEIRVTRLISAFYYEFPEDFKFDGESHPGWEFVYVEKGSVSVRADHMTYVLKSGEMVCHKPHEFHRITPYQGRASVIIFCFECLGERMQYFNNKIITINQRQKHYLNDIVENASKLLLPKSPLDIVKDGAMDRSPAGTVSQEQYIGNTIELLILSLMDSEITERRKRVEFYEQCVQRRTLTSDIIRYLNENISEPIRLSDLSQKFSYSLSSIKRIFKNETGYTVIDYLNNIRIDKAKELLVHSNSSVEDIALTLGFSNAYYFSNCFKKKMGESPSKYRLRERNKA